MSKSREKPRLSESHTEIDGIDILPGDRLKSRKQEFRHRQRQGPLYRLRKFQSVRPGDAVETAIGKMEGVGLDFMPVFDGEGKNAGTIRAEKIKAAKMSGHVDTSEFPVSMVIEPPMKTAKWNYNIEKLGNDEYLAILYNDGTFDKVVTYEDPSNKKESEVTHKRSVKLKTSVKDAIAIMENERIPVLPVLNEKNGIVGSITLERAKKTLEEAGQPFDPLTTRCWTLMDEPLPTVTRRDSYERVATLSGISGAAIVRTSLEEGSPILGIVIKDLDRTRAEGRHGKRMTFLPRKNIKEGGRIKETKRGEGRPGLPALAANVQGVEGMRYSESDLKLVKKWGEHLKDLSLAVAGEGGETVIQPLNERNRLVVGLILEETDKLGLLEKTREPESRADIFVTVRQYLSGCSPQALEDFEKNRPVILEGGKTVAQRLPKQRAIHQPNHDEEIMRRWGSQLKGISMASVDEYGGFSQLEPLPRQNQLLVGLILYEQDKTGLLENIEYGDVRSRIFSTVRDYLQRADVKALKRFETNKPVQLWEGNTVEERLKKPESVDYEEDELIPRYRRVGEIKRGRPLGGESGSMSLAIDDLKVRWTDRSGQTFEERIKSENMQILRLILHEGGKTGLMKAKGDDEDAKQNMLDTARKYIRRHNTAMLRRFDTNIPIYLGQGKTLEERLQNSKSADSRRLSGSKAKKKPDSRQKADEAERIAFREGRIAEEIWAKKMEKDTSTAAEIAFEHIIQKDRGGDGFLPIKGRAMIQSDELPQVIKAIKKRSGRDMEDEAVLRGLEEARYIFMRPKR